MFLASMNYLELECFHLQSEVECVKYWNYIFRFELKILSVYEAYCLIYVFKYSLSKATVSYSKLKKEHGLPKSRKEGNSLC